MAEQPKYLQVAETLRHEIAAGVFRDGQTLMTEEDLRMRFNVSRQTVRQAIALLEDDGLVDRRRGSGTYVRHGPRHRTGPVHVAVITTYITDYIFPNIVSGIESVLNENDCMMSLSATYNDPKLERTILERVLQYQPDGLIVEGARTARDNPNMDLYRKFVERNIPMIFINGYYDELSNVPHVVMDDYGGGRLAARELVKRGYRKLACVFKNDDRQGLERERGFMDELAVYGLEVPKERVLHFTTEDRMTLFQQEKGRTFAAELSRKGAVDGICCYNDAFASGLVLAMSERGTRFPQDVGVIAFDNSSYAEMCHPGLTTFGHPKEAFGATAAEKLLRMIGGEKERSVNMTWTLVERESLPAVIRK